MQIFGSDGSKWHSVWCWRTTIGARNKRNWRLESDIIISQNITKFVGRRYGLEDLQTMATSFVNSVKLYIESCRTENVYNADESGFNLKLHSGRTLSCKRGKTVACIAQSVGSITQSYTIVPIISATDNHLCW